MMGFDLNQLLGWTPWVSPTVGGWGCNIGVENFDLVVLPHEPKRKSKFNLGYSGEMCVAERGSAKYLKCIHCSHLSLKVMSGQVYHFFGK